MALENLHAVLAGLGDEDALDEKLAEYVFFPLSHVFNDSQRLSSRCLESAVKSLNILLDRGWRQKLSPEMGKQLLILLSLLAGGTKSQSEAPSDELRVAAFHCIASLTAYMGRSPNDKSVFDEVGARTIVDGIVYMLLEAITDEPSADVQIAAISSLQLLLSRISDRVILASLLPRTVSALTKASQPSTKTRRSAKFLHHDLQILGGIISAVLRDDVPTHGVAIGPERALEVRSARPGAPDTLPVLDDSWLRATASQVRLALSNVVKLRTHDKPGVRQALVDLSVTVLDHCSNSLFDSVPMLIETLIILASDRDTTTAYHVLERLAGTDSIVAEALKSSLHRWTGSLPRVMQANDDRPKERILQQISTTFNVLSQVGEQTDSLDETLAFNLVQGISNAIQSSSTEPASVLAQPAQPVLKMLDFQDSQNHTSFGKVVLNHTSLKSSMHQVQALISRLRQTSSFEKLTRSILNTVARSDGNTQLAAIWLSLEFLKQDQDHSDNVDEYLDLTQAVDLKNNVRPYLVSELYASTVSILTESPHVIDDGRDIDWRLTALALESLVLQADQLGESFRLELIDVLYPVLSLLGTAQQDLQAQAMTTLDLLGKACGYSNTADMLIENVDYLVNSIGLKLSNFDLTPQVPQVLLMMVRLCGASLIPYLDDTIDDVFVAIDQYHGYPRLIELLFEVFSVIVDEAAKRPQLAITSGQQVSQHLKAGYKPSTFDDIVADLERREAQKSKSDEEHEERIEAPHRPWKSHLDGGPVKEVDETEDDTSDPTEEDDAPLPPQDTKKSLSKPHDLLLSIASSTPPHLASPSPQVRLTLLQLLTRISTLLSQDENSFLPLVNAVWPSIVPQLLSPDDDPAYVTCAAAETISALCVGGGDFMTSRVEDIFPQLAKLYEGIFAKVADAKKRESSRRVPLEASSGKSGSSLRGIVDLHVVKSENEPKSASSLTTASQPRVRQSLTNHHSYTKIHASLIAVFTTTLTHVRIPDSIGDSILDLLAPIMDEPGHEDILTALKTWNADAVWVVREHRRLVKEMQRNERAVGDWDWRSDAGEENS